MSNDEPVDDSPPESKAAQTPGHPPPVAQAQDDEGSRDNLFLIGPGVMRPVGTRPHARLRGEPMYRRLRIYALDPSASKLDGAVADVDIPYEPVAPGPSGALFEVHDYDETRNRHYSSVDLERPFVLMEDGHAPSPGDPSFHQQMVYAVASRVYYAFKLALGRDLAWAFATPRLRLRPHAFEGHNAYYDRSKRELAFGYYRNEERVSGRNLPGGTTFTCLSHDIIAHETTHALLDGLRANFMVTTGADVLALHEAIADLVAVFLHFQYPEIVKNALRNAGGDLRQPSLISDLAGQFGQTTGAGRALRYAIEDMKPNADVAVYDRRKESHKLGAVLVAAVYEAFVTVFDRKVARVRRLASGGSNIIDRRDLGPDLLDYLANSARKLASNFLSICIRALDYCPTVDVKFGEYLRAMITADADLVPDDPWAYREALIDAFRRRLIFPPGVQNLAEESLRWEPAAAGLSIPALHYRELRFAGDPATAASPEELLRQARAVGRAAVRDNATRAAFGLAPADEPDVGKPTVESVRSLRRIGPDSQIVFDIVAEVTQERLTSLSSGGPPFTFLGGATIIVGPEGGVRHVIYKRVMNDRRLEEQRQFITGAGRAYWRDVDGVLTTISAPLRMVHQDTQMTDSKPHRGSKRSTDILNT